LDRPFGFHLTNLLLHLACAAVFFFLARQVLRLAIVKPADDAGAIAIDDSRAREQMLNLAAGSVALIFALHPLRAETVAWVTERRGLLCALFYFLSVSAYLRSRMHGRGYAMSVIFAICAVLSKPMAISIPFVILALDFYPLRRFGSEPAGRIIRGKIPFVMVMIGGVALTFAGYNQHTGMTNFTDRVAVVSYGLMFYPLKTLFPLGLTNIYQYYPGIDLLQFKYIASFAGFVTVTALALKNWRRHPAWLTIWACYGFMIAPVAGLLQVGSHVAADRYAYLACAPFVIPAGAVVFWLGCARFRYLAVASLVALAVAFGMLACRQTGAWRNGLTLWRNAVRIDPQSPRALDGHGESLYYAKHSRMAICDLNRCVAEYSDFQILLDRGIVLISLGQFDAAMQDLNRATELRPQDAQALSYRGSLELVGNRLPEAVRDLSESVRLDPKLDSTWHNLGQAYRATGQYAQAIDAFSHALAFKPNRPGTLFAMADAYCSQQDFASGWAALQKCRKLGPGDDEQLMPKVRQLENMIRQELDSRPGG
jgi:protein O-mannosyl-transferase